MLKLTRQVKADLRLMKGGRGRERGRDSTHSRTPPDTHTHAHTHTHTHTRQLAWPAQQISDRSVANPFEWVWKIWVMVLIELWIFRRECATGQQDAEAGAWICMQCHVTTIRYIKLWTFLRLCGRVCVLFRSVWSVKMSSKRERESMQYCVVVSARMCRVGQNLYCVSVSRGQKCELWPELLLCQCECTHV